MKSIVVFGLFMAVSLFAKDNRELYHLQKDVDTLKVLNTKLIEENTKLIEENSSLKKNYKEIKKSVEIINKRVDSLLIKEQQLTNRLSQYVSQGGTFVSSDSSVKIKNSFPMSAKITSKSVYEKTNLALSVIFKNQSNSKSIDGFSTTIKIYQDNNLLYETDLNISKPVLFNDTLIWSGAFPIDFNKNKHIIFHNATIEQLNVKLIVKSITVDGVVTPINN